MNRPYAFIRNAPHAAPLRPNLTGDDKDDDQSIERGDERGRDLDRSLQLIRADQERAEKNRRGNRPNGMQPAKERGDDAIESGVARESEHRSIAE